MGQKESLLAMTKDIIPVPSHVYVDGMWVTKEPKQVSIADEGLGSPPHLKFVTYNVWFEHHFFELRAQKLRDVLRECDADVICLQEVTREFLQGLVATEWVRAHYVVSDVEGDSIHGYGVVMLVKKEFHPLFRFRSFPTQQGRRALVADLHVPGLSDPLRVCTAHFESLNPSVDYRKVQFEIVFMDVASEAAHAVVMGDFNMDPSWALEQQHVPAAYVDAWVATHDASQAGYTMTAFAEFPAWRPDRALLRSPVLAVTSCTLLGTEDIGSACTECPVEYGRPCTPSDHYGLLMTVALDAARAAEQQAAARELHALVVQKAVEEAAQKDTERTERSTEAKVTLQLPTNRRFSQEARAAEQETKTPTQ